MEEQEYEALRKEQDEYLNELQRPTRNHFGLPYADGGDDVARQARWLLESLCVPLEAAGYYDERPGQKTRWHEADEEALMEYLLLEELVPRMRPTDEVSHEEMDAFMVKMYALRAAMPLTEPERHWVRQLWNAFDSAETNFDEALERQEAEVVVAGLRQVVKGDEILRRWTAWRKETDEFAGQGTLDMAREATRGILALIWPSAPYPDAYLRLRAEISPPTAEP
jgi:hypothetical protein